MISLLEFLLTEQHKEIPFLGHIPCFRELRSNAGLSEAKIPFISRPKTKPKITATDKKKALPDFAQWKDAQSPDYAIDIHDHPKIRPRSISIKGSAAIERYTGHGSVGLNNYLHRLAANTNEREDPGRHSLAQDLMSMYTPQNTNRRDVRTYAGIPTSVGEQLAKSKKGSQFHLPAFTSTTTCRYKAHEFANKAAKIAESNFKPDYDEDLEYSKTRADNHIIHFNVLAPTREQDSGSGLSILAHAIAADENEILIHPGAKITYKGTTSYRNREGENDNVVHVHQVDVHPLREAKPLSKYPGEPARKKMERARLRKGKSK